MFLLNKLRRRLFWFLDKLKGGQIKTDLNDITDSLSQSSFKYLQKKNEPILEKLLQTTVECSPFYNEFKNFKNLQDFPVVNKSIIKDNFDEIFVRSKKSSNIIKVTTSGSTGAPFSVYQGKRKKNRNTADTLFFAKSSGFELGDQLLYLRSWTKYLKKNILLAKIQNILTLDVIDNSDEYYERLFEKLHKSKSQKGWLGYPSAFENVCDYLDKINSKPVNCNVTSIIAMSEALTQSTKDRMEYYFQVPVVSRYSNIENGIIAQQMRGSNNFTVNWASYIVEILDLERDISVEPGEIGRIVITDLYNSITPMIRYDTGDLGNFTIDSKNKNVFPMLKTVYGRSLDAITGTNGKIINPFVIFGNFYKFPELSQIQLIQESQYDYTFLVNYDEEFTREKEFLNFFKSYLGEDAKVTIKYIDKIPLLNSGKRRVLVNQYKQSLN